MMPAHIFADFCIIVHGDRSAELGVPMPMALSRVAAVAMFAACLGESIGRGIWAIKMHILFLILLKME